MVRTLQQSKASLSELVELAATGEDVLITVRGRAVARLTAVAPPARVVDGATWARELRELQLACSTGKVGISSDEILDELRADQ